MKTLNQILHDFENVWQQIPAEAENIDEMMDEIFKLRNDIADNVDRRIGFIQHAENLADFYEQKAKEYKKEAARLIRSVDGLKQNTLNIMKNNPETIFKGQLGEFKIRKSGNPSCHVESFDMVPSLYKVTQTEVNLNKRLMIEDMKAGKEIPGCQLVYTETVGISKKVI